MPREIEDRVGAFVPGPRTQRAGAAKGPLAGLDFAVKDLYDIAGDVTGYGNPDWARTHAPAAADAADRHARCWRPARGCAARPRPSSSPMG